MPRFELTLQFEEFSVLHSAVRSAVDHYGGALSLSVAIRKEEAGLRWAVTLPDPQTMEAVKACTSEMTTEVVRAIDFDRLDPGNVGMLKVLQSLNTEIAHAAAHPVWDPVTVAGLIRDVGDRVVIEADSGELDVTGPRLEESRTLSGKRVIATGYRKVAGEIEVDSVAEKRANTLEVFVMSHCPHSLMAQAYILDRLDGLDSAARPAVEFHFIFYRRPDPAVEGPWWSLHGEAELRENLVQMLLRESYPHVVVDYLRRRLADLDRPWAELATGVGLTESDILVIEERLAVERDALIEQEYLYATERYGIQDGSPTFVWEGERIVDLRAIPAFEGMGPAQRGCRRDGG